MKKLLTYISIAVAVLAAAYTYMVKSFMPGYLEEMRPQVESIATDYVNGSVEIGTLKWEGGLSAEVDGIVLRDTQKQLIAELPKTVVEVKPWRVLQGAERVLSAVELQSPIVYLTMDDKKEWNTKNLLKPSDSEETPFYGLLRIKDGLLKVKMPEGAWDFRVQGTVDGAPNPNFDVDAQVFAGEEELKLQGQMTTKGKGRLQLTGKQLSLAPYAKVAESYSQVKALQGALRDMHLIYDNKEGNPLFSGEVVLADVTGKYNYNNKDYALKVAGKVKADENVVTVKGFKAAVDQQEVTLDATANLQNSDEPQAQGLLAAEKLEYEGRSITKLRLPFLVDKKTVQIDRASVNYGGGQVVLNGEYLFDEKKLVSDVHLENITHPLTVGGSDTVKVNGDLAVLAHEHDKDIVFHTASNAFNLQWRSLTIDKVAMDGHFDGKQMNIKHVSAFAGKGSMVASGTIGIDGALNLEGRMVEFPINPFLDIATGAKGSGLCSTGFKLSGNLSAPEYAGVIQITEAELYGQKIKEGHGFFSLKDNLVTIKDFKAQMDKGTHLLAGTIDLKGEEPYFDLSVETNGVRIEPLMSLISSPVPVTGNLDNIVQVRGTPSNIWIDGEVHATDGSAMQNLFNSVSGRYEYKNGNLALHSFVVNALFAQLELEGTMSANQALDFDFKGKNIDLYHLPITSEGWELTGLLSANGHLGGTLTNPLFSGDIESDKVTVNGESFTELLGNLDSNGRDYNKLDVSFKQPYKGNPSEYGLYTANLNLNIPQKFLNGKVAMKWGDINGLLRMANMDYNIHGYMNGSLDINPKGKGSGINIDVSADDVKVHDRTYAHAVFKGRTRQGVLYFDDVYLHENDELPDKGLINISGDIDLLKRNYNVELNALDANPAIINAAMKDPLDLKGSMNMTMSLKGPFEQPDGSGYIIITDGSLSGITMDSVMASLSMKNDIIHLDELLVSKGVYNVKAKGDIPVDLFRSREERRNPNAQMNLDLDLNEARLGILPALFDQVEWAVGETKGNIKITGTLEEPLLNGNLKLEDGNIKLKDIDSVMEKIKLDVAFQGNRVSLNDLSMHLGKGTLAASGSYALRASEAETYKLDVKATNAEISSRIFKGKINADVEIVPKRYRRPPQKGVKHTFRPAPAYRPNIRGAVRLDDVLVNMPTVPELGEGSSNYGLELELQLGPKIHFYNSYLYDIWLKGGIKITGGTDFPVIEGNIFADKGSVTYLRTPFKIEKASLAWVDPGTFLPNVKLESMARFSRYNIYMKITGPVDNMDLVLTSDPPQDQNTLVRMLTLQRDTAGSAEVTGDDVTNLMTAGLQMTVLGDVEMLIKQTLGLDQFHVYTGKVRAGIGFENARDNVRELTAEERNQYNVLASRYLTNNLLVGYTTSFDGDNSAVFAKYDISKHFNVTYSRTSDSSKEKENWYGVEYKIGF